MDYEQFSSLSGMNIADLFQRVVELNYGYCDELPADLDAAYKLLGGLYDSVNHLALYEAIQEHAPLLTIDKYGRFSIPIFPYKGGTRCRMRIVMNILRTYYQIIGVDIEGGRDERL